MQNKTPPISNQDAFNRIWQFFIVEGHNQSKGERFCQYRGDEKGSACAVGCMMPTAMARKGDSLVLNGDNSSIQRVMEKFPSIEEWFSKVDLNFLKKAQEKHDNEDFDANKEQYLTDLAEDFGLAILATSQLTEAK